MAQRMTNVIEIDSVHGFIQSGKLREAMCIRLVNYGLGIDV